MLCHAKAIFPNGLKVSQLEDVDFPEHHAANAKPDADSDSDHDSGTDFDSELFISDDLSSCSNSGEDDEVEIVWAKAGHEICTLPMCLRASFTSPKILWMTVLCQGKGSLNAFKSLLPSLPQSLPQRASICNCSR